MLFTEIESLINKLPSRSVWRARKGIGSFVTIDLGKRCVAAREDGSEEETADLNLWVHLCDWDLTKRGQTVLTSDSHESAFDGALAALLSTDLLGIEMSLSQRELQIVFTNDVRFHLRSNLDEYELEDDMLIVSFRNREAVGYRVDIGFYRDSDLGA